MQASPAPCTAGRPDGLLERSPAAVDGPLPAASQPRGRDVIQRTSAWTSITPAFGTRTLRRSFLSELSSPIPALLHDSHQTAELLRPAERGPSSRYLDSPRVHRELIGPAIPSLHGKSSATSLQTYACSFPSRRHRPVALPRAGMSSRRARLGYGSRSTITTWRSTRRSRDSATRRRCSGRVEAWAEAFRQARLRPRAHVSRVPLPVRSAAARYDVCGYFFRPYRRWRAAALLRHMQAQGSTSTVSSPTSTERRTRVWDVHVQHAVRPGQAYMPLTRPRSMDPA